MSRGQPRTEEAGQTLVVFVIFLMVCVMFVGLVVDGGMYFFERREMQGTADAAAMAAVRELPGSVGEADTAARDYVTNQNGVAGGVVRDLQFSDGNRRVEILVGKAGTSSFGEVLGISRPEIAARAVARVQMMGPRPGMLPFGFMRGTYTIGENTEVKWDDPGSGNRGALAPDMMPNCGNASGANDFRDLIKSSEFGGVDACPTPLQATLDTEPGNMAGPTRQGFDQRIGGDGQGYGTLVGTDPGTGFQTIEDPNSPRIGMVPIIENLDGTTGWPTGRAEIRIIGYMMVYIGNRDVPGSPAYSNGGKSVWMTPIRPILPDEFATDNFIDFDNDIPSPVVYRLVE